MNLLPHSNGFERIKQRKYSFLEICKKTLTIILVLLFVGFLAQMMSNFFSNEKIKPNLKYVRVDSNKLEYKIRGTGQYTVVFEGGIGTNIYQWDEVCKTLEGNSDIKTFVYNRHGYGFSDSAEKKSPEQQADELRVLLRKSGASEPYIFVGEEYGSLVATSFAQKYPELVSGLIFINPLSKELINSPEYLKSIRWEYYKSKLEFIGSYFYLTELSDKFGLLKENEGFEEDISIGALEEFNIHKNKKNYRKAVSDELSNLYKKNFDIQSIDEFNKIPIYIISNKIESKYENLQENSLITLYESSILGTPYVIKDKDTVVSAINNTVKKVKKLDKS
ncbi:alpha/beta hydrolase [Clostridium sp. CTA-5]